MKTMRVELKGGLGFERLLDLDQAGLTYKFH